MPSVRKHPHTQEGWSLLHKVMVWHAGLPTMIYELSSKVWEMNVAVRTHSICDLWSQSDPWTADYSPGPSGWVYIRETWEGFIALWGSIVYLLTCFSAGNEVKVQFFSSNSCFWVIIWAVFTSVSIATKSWIRNHPVCTVVSDSSLLPVSNSWIICPLFSFVLWFQSFGLVLTAICFFAWRIFCVLELWDSPTIYFAILGHLEFLLPLNKSQIHSTVCGVSSKVPPFPGQIWIVPWNLNHLWVTVPWVIQHNCIELSASLFTICSFPTI